MPRGVVGGGDRGAQQEHRRDIEGLRAIAVLAVLLYHFGVPGVGGGFIGVDVFFVVSGFLITSLLITERQERGRVSIPSFYARRARRLLPISATVLVATALGGAVLLPETRLHDLAAEVTASASFAANVLFAVRGADYLTAQLDPSPLRHFWSLAVEEQFYLVWPALIAVVTLGAHRVLRRVAAVMAVVVVASYLASGFLTPLAPTWSYFGLHTRAWELGVGALLAALAPELGRVPERVRSLLGWTGLAVVAASAVTFGSVSAFPGWVAVVPVVATAAVLAAGDRTPAGPQVLLRLRPLQYVGSRSYSLYLWHWPVLVLAEARLGRPLTLAESLLAAVGVVSVAEVGYRMVEQPVRTSPVLLRRPSWSLALGAALVLTGLGAGVALDAYRPDLSTGVVADAPSLDGGSTTALSTAPPVTEPTDTAGASASTDDVTVPTEAPTTTVPAAPTPISMASVQPLQAVVDAVANEVAPDNLRPSLMRAGRDAGVIYGNGCHQYHRTSVNRNCVFGDPDGSVTIALWGDSHAAQWFPALESIATSRGWRLLSLTQGGCPYLDIEVYNVGDGAVSRHCGPWRRSVREYMVEQGVDVVFVSEYYRLRAASGRRPFTIDQWTAQLPTLIDGLRADGVEPIVIGDTPDPPGSTPGCVAGNRRHVSKCAARTDDADTVSRNDTVRSITSAHGVGFIEPARWMCVDGVCPVVVGDILVYRDGDHLTSTFTSWLAPLIDALVAPFVEQHLRYRAG